MELIIITGMSGAGKSGAANALEDLGFYCIDNIPPSLISAFVDLSYRAQSQMSRVAIVTDTRGGELFNSAKEIFAQLKQNGIKFKLLFLDANDETLVRRYKETRRKHPMMKTSSNFSLIDAVKKERTILDDIKKTADFVVDTSLLTVRTLKQRLTSLFVGDISKGLNIECISFGFKYGIVPEADLVFDVRCLSNPYYVDELRNLTGLDEKIQNFVMDLSNTQGLLDRLYNLLDYIVPLYCDEGKSQLIIAIGCTGGKHRSVVFTEKIYKHLLNNNYSVSISHRDILK